MSGEAPKPSGLSQEECEKFLHGLVARGAVSLAICVEALEEIADSNGILSAGDLRELAREALRRVR